MRGSVPYWGAGGVLDFVDQAIFNEPLILLKEDGSPFFIPGKGVAYYVEGPTWINNHIHALRATGADGRFLAYALNCVDYSNYLTGSTRDKLTQEDLKKIDIWQPPLKEQRRIADFLDAETARIGQLFSLQQQVMRRLDEREAAQLDLAIDDLVEIHGTVPLRRFLMGVDQGSSPQCEAVPATDDEWGVLKVSCLRPGLFLPYENKRLPEGVNPDRASEVREGDLLITRANTPQLVGSTAVVHKVRSKLLLSDKIFRVRLSPEISPDFVATVARGSRIRALCAAGSNGASQSMANIRFEEVKAWPLPAVGADLQRDLVVRISRGRAQLNALRPKVNRQLDLLAERRQALITAAVTGQFDVTTASGRNVTDGVTA
jgi:type I restriction enzyme, S subunit